MPRISAVPYSEMDSELKAIVHASDEALNGSESGPVFLSSDRTL